MGGGAAGFTASFCLKLFFRWFGSRYIDSIHELPILPALGRRDRLELSVVAPELSEIFYGLRAKGCYTDTQRVLESYTETI